MDGILLQPFYRMIVNGPSLRSSTFISAPNSPCSTTETCSLQTDINFSYIRLASTGSLAPMKEGRLPWLQSAHNVNCDTIRSSPLTSERALLVLPFSSSNMRILTILSAYFFNISSESPDSIPKNKKPLLIYLLYCRQL